MSSQVDDIVEAYATGQIDFNTAREQLREVDPDPTGSGQNHGWYTENIDLSDGNSVVDLQTACMIHDLTAQEYGLLKKSLMGTRRTPREEEEAPTDEAESGETAEQDFDSPLHLLELLGGNEGELVYAPAGEGIDFSYDGEGEASPEEEAPAPEEEEEEVAKHGDEHDEEDHGNWADGIRSVADKVMGRGSGKVKSTNVPGGAPEAPEAAASSTEAPLKGSFEEWIANKQSSGAVVEREPEPVDETARSSGKAGEGARQISRPKSLDDLIGQDRIRDNLKISALAAKKSGRVMPHVMLAGPAGLGKTTMAKALANDLGIGEDKLKVITGPLVDKEELAGLLAEIEEGDVLFIDEIHSMDKGAQELLFPAMEDFEFDYEMPDGSTERIELPPFTLLGATTNPEKMLRPLRERFQNRERLDYYTADDLGSLAQMSAKKLGFELDDETAFELGQRGRGTPRILNQLVKQVSEYATALDKPFNSQTASEALSRRGIDSKGLTVEDRSYLQTLADSPRPMGAENLADYTGMDEDAISDIVEPWLLRLGFIQRSGRGRIVTDAGREHLEAYESTLNKMFVGEGIPIQIAKSNSRRNLVFGWANVSHHDSRQILDRQQHAIDLEELENAAYDFVVKARTSGDMHEGEGFGELVESVVVTQDKIDAGAFTQDRLGHWWVGFRVPPEHWDAVQSGDRRMFSIQGKARLEPFEKHADHNQKDHGNRGSMRFSIPITSTATKMAVPTEYAGQALVLRSGASDRLVLLDSPLRQRQQEWVNNSKGYEWIAHEVEVGSIVKMKVGRKTTEATVVAMVTGDQIKGTAPSKRLPTYVLDQ